MKLFRLKRKPRPPRLPVAAWADPVAFDEYAEVLGIDLTQILSVMPGQTEALVVYSPSPASSELWTVIVARGIDDVLVKASTPVRRPGLWDEMARDPERALLDLRQKAKLS